MPFLVNANLRRHHPPAPGVVRWEWIDRCRIRVFVNERRRLAEGRRNVPAGLACRGGDRRRRWPCPSDRKLVQLERDHALVVVRGAVCEVFLLTLRRHLANLVAAGVRFVVLDLAEVTACPPEMVGELATACRELYTRQGWLRSITTAPCVADALESAELDDLFPIYRAAGTEFRYAS